MQSDAEARELAIREAFGVRKSSFALLGESFVSATKTAQKKAKEDFRTPNASRSFVAFYQTNRAMQEIY